MSTKKFICKRRDGQGEPMEIESRNAEYAAEHFAEQTCRLPADNEMEVIVSDGTEERCFDVTLEYDVHASAMEFDEEQPCGG